MKAKELRFIARYEPSNKVWGWYTDLVDVDGVKRRYAFAFWAVIGKTISIKRHPLWGRSNLRDLEKQKITNKYFEITEAELLERWPSFWDDLEQRLLFVSLSDGW